MRLHGLLLLLGLVAAGRAVNASTTQFCDPFIVATCRSNARLFDALNGVEAPEVSALPASAGAVEAADLVATGGADAVLTVAPLGEFADDAGDCGGASAAECRSVSAYPAGVVPYVLVARVPAGADGLVVDEDTAALLLAGNITHWNDTRLALSAYDDTPVTVVTATARATAEAASYVLGDPPPGIPHWPWEAPGVELDGSVTEVDALFAALSVEGGVAFVPMPTVALADMRDFVVPARNAAGVTVAAPDETAVEAAAVSELPSVSSRNATGGALASARVSRPSSERAWPWVTYLTLVVGNGGGADACEAADTALHQAVWSLQGRHADVSRGMFNLPHEAAASTVAAVRQSACDGSRNSAGETLFAGRGAEFPSGVYDVWARLYAGLPAGQGLVNTYDKINSGAGKAGIIAGEVDYACADSLLTEEMYEAGGDLVMLPLLAGSIVIVFRLPDSVGLEAGPMVFSREVAAGIFEGTVSSWRDPALLALNPHLALPDLDISVVHRTDASGETAILTNALSRFSASFNATHGPYDQLTWAVDAAGRGIGSTSRESMVGAVAGTAGAVGYVAVGYATEVGLPFASIVNSFGTTVVPSAETLGSAMADFAGSAVDGGRLTISLADGPGELSWPIASYTYLVVPTTRAVTDCETSRAMLRFWKWGLTDESTIQLALELGFVTTQGDTLERVLAAIGSATCEGVPLVGGCPPGERADEEANLCVPCPPGHFSTAADRVCVECPPNTWSAGGSGVAECTPCLSHETQPLTGQPACVANSLVEISTGAVVGGGVAASLLIVACAAAGALMWRKRKHPIVVSSTAPFLFVVLAGLAVAASTVFVASRGKRQAGVCALVPYVASMGFWLVTAPLGLKTHRLHRIFNSTQLSVRKISTARLTLTLVGVLAAESAVHALRETIDPVRPARQTAIGTVASDVYVCESGGAAAAWWVLMLAPKVLLLLYVNVLAYKVRGLAAEFNESRSLATVAALLTFLLGSVLGLMSAAEGSPSLEFALLSAGLLTAGGGTLSLVHISKLWSMYVTHFHSRKSGIGSGTAGSKRTTKRRGSGAVTPRQKGTNSRAPPSPGSRGRRTLTVKQPGASGANGKAAGRRATARASYGNSTTPQISVLSPARQASASDVRANDIAVELPSLSAAEHGATPAVLPLAGVSNGVGSSSAAASPRSP